MSVPVCQTIFYFLFSEFPRVSTSFKQHFNNKFTTFLFYIFFTPTTFHANEKKKIQMSVPGCQNIILF